MRRLRLMFVLLALPLAGCALNGGPASYAISHKAPYQLDTGDVVRVSVYGEAELSKSYRVDDAGNVSLALVGSVQVRGKSTEVAAATIAAALSRGYIRDPSVAVEIDTYRPFYIQGGVKTAGQFAFIDGMTIRAAISSAGGFTNQAGRERAVLYRKRGDQLIKSIVNLDTPIAPGDLIVVPESLF
jgi:polysaccharide biosynthesis/export protein